MEITEELKREIWEKGIVDEKYPSDRVRKDACGAFMVYERFGDRDSIFGWEFDHIYPASLLRSKGASYPFYTASLEADDKAATNKEVSIGKVVNEQVQQELNDHFKLND